VSHVPTLDMQVDYGLGIESRLAPAPSRASAMAHRPTKRIPRATPCPRVRHVPATPARVPSHADLAPIVQPCLSTIRCAKRTRYCWTGIYGPSHVNIPSRRSSSSAHARVMPHTLRAQIDSHGATFSCNAKAISLFQCQQSESICFVTEVRARHDTLFSGLMTPLPCARYGHTPCVWPKADNAGRCNAAGQQVSTRHLSPGWQVSKAHLV
jgi:hypothetical protein